ncbi:MAG: phosphopentomutase [Intestinibaculum porci]|uniref:phosphopentomutase n=1 Tax=Intestinibaculum porci TaxID=2487118 RepID=UPI00240A4B73|nr:phosphopentomutase [Intestinibaculum porci]MDD6422615.1 phosphopentomutase [Intestinibaculum porci]
MSNELYKRIFVIVCDSMGIGNAEDAAKFGDEGANTIKHIAEAKNGLDVENLEGLGLGNLGDFEGIHPIKAQLGTTAALREVSNGKDTMTGHWEMMGLKVEKPFKTFTDTGFPEEFIHLFEEKTGRKCVGNYAESGTVILDKYGEHQIATGDWIVYTSADSVFQIAANEDVIPLEELYKACEIARELLMRDEWKVGRVIARPYVGTHKGAFKRTANRHDYALEPFGDTVLDTLKAGGFDVVGVGKIPDIFVNKGITKGIHTVSNEDGMNKTIELAKGSQHGLVFVNLVDFDAVYGHRRNAIGYGDAIEAFDRQLQDLMAAINEDDLIMITADHGNDPTWKGTDHTREHVPLIMYSKTLKRPKNLGLLESYAVIGATIADNFNVKNPGIGYSLLKELERD